MKNITDSLLAVSVPFDCDLFSLNENNLGGFINSTLDIKSNQFLTFGKKEKLGSTQYYAPDKFYMSEGNWKIIGTVTKDKVDFDCSKYVKNELWSSPCGEEVLIQVYKEYNGIKDYHTTKEESFLSLLQAKGIDLKEDEKVLIIEKI